MARIGSRQGQEADLFKAFKEGTGKPDDSPNYWTDLVGVAVRSGRPMRRVHVVTRPLSDYPRFEFEHYYQFNVKAGEDVRILDVTDRPRPALPDFDF